MIEVPRMTLRRLAIESEFAADNKKKTVENMLHIQNTFIIYIIYFLQFITNIPDKSFKKKV